MKTNKKIMIDIVSMILCIIFALIAHFNLFNSAIVFWWLSLIVGARAKFIEGVKNTIAHKSLNVEFLMILSALGAFFIENYSEGVILIIIFGISGILEEMSLAKSEKSLSSLLKLTPTHANKVNSDGSLSQVDIQDIQIGDILLVKVGEQVSADGIIIFGQTTLDVSGITGESIPISRSEGQEVISGSINQQGVFRMKVEVAPSDSTLQKIIDFVQEASSSQTRQETFIEKFEAIYVYAVLIGAILLATVPALLNIWDFNTAIYRAIVLLVVASPCALVASVTPTMLATLSNGASKGILIKGSPHIETIAKVKNVALDKTGTITKGHPEVMSFQIADELLPLIKTAELNSNHPLAQAIVKAIDADILNVNLDIQEEAGHGIAFTYQNHHYQIGNYETPVDSIWQPQIAKSHQQGHSVVKVLCDNELIGIIELSDSIRSSAKETIDQLHHYDLNVVMLTGDHQAAATMIAQEVGIDRAIGDCLPLDKASYVQQIKQENGPTMMVGDGINDGPSLATADIGVAMGSGQGVALETADVVFMNDNLSNLDQLFNMSKKAQRIINFNIIFSMGILTLLVFMNVFQIIDLPFGVLLHEGSTIIVILNGLRNLR